MLAVRGELSMPWSTQRWNGLTGSTIAGCSSRSGTCRRPSTSRRIIDSTRVRPWRPDSTTELSGNPGAVQTAEGWLYLGAVLDLCSGMIVGWLMSHRQTRDLVLQAVLMALWQREDRAPVILHSDRGCQFTSGEYQRFLAGHNLVCSMSAVGSCADNAAMEGFFGLLKRERVNRRIYQTRAQARAEVFGYIERFHNSRRRRRLQAAAQKESLLTQLSAKTG